jgi:nicotinamidase/pyrazinamidase
MSETAGPAPGDALVIVDVQRDFLPGGALAVPDGERVVPVLNRYVEAFTARGLPVIATRDWHPPDHRSFVQQEGLWPPHCVQGTPGAEFSSELALPADTIVVSKGTLPEVAGYSAFDGTDFEQILCELKINRLWIGGLATEFCVLQTAQDALEHRFAVVLLVDAIGALDPAAGSRAIARLAEREARTFRWEDDA